MVAVCDPSPFEFGFLEDDEEVSFGFRGFEVVDCSGQAGHLRRGSGFRANRVCFLEVDQEGSFESGRSDQGVRFGP